MSEWIDSSLGELCDQRKGITYKSKDYCEEGTGFPFLTIKTFEKGGGFDPSGVKYYNGSFLPQDILKQDDVLIAVTDLTRAGDIVGSPLLVPGFGTADFALASMDCMKLTPIAQKCDKKFLYYSLMDNAIRRQMVANSRGSTVLHLDTKCIPDMKIKVPVQKKIQKKIAELLSTIDAQIEQTEALIAKQENIRRGLMQDLFTRGVDATGQLRPAYQDAPHLYHETELGWLPKGWKVKRISQLLELKSNAMRSGPFGSSLLKNELVVTGIPFLGIDNIFTEFFKPEFSRYVTERKFLELSRYQVFPDDVIISIMGTVGRCCVVPNIKSKMLSSKHLWTMSFNQNQILSNLVCWQLNYAPWILAWFRRETQGGIMDAIQSSTLKNTKLVVPDEASQTVLNKIYIDERKRISSLKDQLAKSNLIKAGLMRDLLSGDVSVAPLMQETSA